MIKAIHTADIHLDIENYGSIDPETGHSLRMFDFIKALDKIVDYAIEKEVDVFFFAGDAFRVRDPNPTKRDFFDQRIIRLAERGIQVVMITGNHDVPNNVHRQSSICAFKTLKLKNVHMSSRMEILSIETRNGPLQVVTFPYQTVPMLLEQSETQGKTVSEIDVLFLDAIKSKLKVLASQLKEDIPAILIGHCTVAGSVPSSEKEIALGKEIIVPYEALALPQYDYVALGHIHAHQVMQEGIFPPVVYSGSPERVDFSEEKQKKGFIRLSIEKGNTKFAFEEIEARKMFTLDVDLKDDPNNEFLAVVKKHIKSITDAIVRPKIQIDRSKLTEWDENKVLKQMKKAFYILPFHREIRIDGKPRDLDVTNQMEPIVALEKWNEKRTSTPDVIKEKMKLKLGELHEKILIKRGIY